MLKKADRTTNQQRQNSWISSFDSLDYQGSHSLPVVPFHHNSKTTVPLKICCNKSEQPWWGLQECRRSRDQGTRLFAVLLDGFPQGKGRWLTQEAFLHQRLWIARHMNKAYWLIPPYIILILPLGGSKRKSYFSILWDQNRKVQEGFRWTTLSSAQPETKFLLRPDQIELILLSALLNSTIAWDTRYSHLQRLVPSMYIGIFNL